MGNGGQKAHSIFHQNLKSEKSCSIVRPFYLDRFALSKRKNFDGLTDCVCVDTLIVVTMYLSPSSVTNIDVDNFNSCLPWFAFQNLF